MGLPFVKWAGRVPPYLLIWAYIMKISLLIAAGGLARHAKTVRKLERVEYSEHPQNDRSRDVHVTSCGTSAFI